MGCPKHPDHCLVDQMVRIVQQPRGQPQVGTNSPSRMRAKVAGNSAVQNRLAILRFTGTGTPRTSSPAPYPPGNTCR